MTNIAVQYQNWEQSRRYFRDQCRHPEGKLLDYRRLTDLFPFEINGVPFAVRPGFWWDGASIPKIVWSIVGDPWQHDIAPGGLIHDVLYATHCVPRAFADDVFYAVNEANGMSPAKNWTVYHAVRAFGRKAWNEKTPEMIAGARRHLTIGNGCVEAYPGLLTALAIA